MYPLLFAPNFHVVVWGGDRLRPYKGLPVTDETIGESWEVSAVPGSVSVINNGAWAGRDLVSVVSEMPEAILGKEVARRFHGQLPLLVKFIDARKDLSIQVHPNDEMAQRIHGKMGKSEMWYIIDAKPGSYLYAGFKEEISPEEYKQHIKNGTITEVLARHEVKRGDVFFLPSGRVHSIGEGILLAEIQQSSDVTYRIFDYNRPGLDGKPRELHTELAAQALNYHVADNYRTDYALTVNQPLVVTDSPYFRVWLTEADVVLRRNLMQYDSFVICMCVEGNCTLRLHSNGEEVVLRQGNSCLVPAQVADYEIIPMGERTRLLETLIH